jgi:hypothetical protein
MSWGRSVAVGGAVALLSSIAGPADAADPVVKGTFRGAVKAVHFDISPPLRSIPQSAVTIEDDEHEDERERPSGLEGAFGPQTPDGALQSKLGTGEIPTPTVSFDTVGGLGPNPPDSVGDVGPNHYVVMSNLRFAVFAKTGGAAILGPLNNNTLWAGFGGACQTENAGDPVVLHDQLADRWFLTQFTAAGPNFFICVAVSQTPDPTGAYFRYAFPTGVNFPDYPKFGIWPDGFYISTREFSPAGPFAGVGAYAVDRAQMIAGNPTATMLSFLVPPGATPYNTGDGILPADIDGTTPPPPGSPSYWVGSMDQGGPYGAPQDALTLWRYVADFTTPANSSFTLASTLPIATYDTVYPCPGGGRRCIPQPPPTASTQFLDILSYRQRPLHRLAYRNFGTHESLVTNQSVEAGPAPMSGIRWWEIRSPNAATPVIFQEGTYAPGLTDGIHRWMGSLAMDRAGNMALGYSVSDATATFPGIRYTGRLVTDAAGQMPQGEGTFVNGVGLQTTTNNRWGDYASMNIDPVDDCTFWFISEYYPVTSTSAWMLRVGSFRYPAPQCIPVPVELQSFTIQD